MKTGVLAAVLCGTLLASSPAFAEPGFLSASVNLRAGPGTHYPALLVIPAGAPLEIIGCLSGYGWCDVAWGDNRGWVSGRYLQSFAAGRPVALRRAPAPV